MRAKVRRILEVILRVSNVLPHKIDCRLVHPLASPGVHNGCWMASPQDAERSNVLDFQAYVETVVTHFVNDTRVRWWEMYVHNSIDC